MSFKSAILKPSILYRSGINTKLGFNLDKWLYDELVSLGILSSSTTCCKVNNLFLKNGFVFTNAKGGFNLDQYLSKILGRLSVATNNWCCPSTDIKIQEANVFYSSTASHSFLDWIKDRLTYYSILFTDPCCAPRAIPVNFVNVYYGIGAPPITLAEILAGSVLSVASGFNIPIHWPENSTPNYYWMAQPQTEPIKTATNNGLSDEAIGSGHSYETTIVDIYDVYETANQVLSSYTSFNI